MECWHMSGAGNDFMVVDARGRSLNFEKMARELCALSGADGFMAVDTSEKADFRLHFYNSDGTRAEMCGNGSRCVCRFAYEHGIAGENMVVQTDAGLVPGRRLSQCRYLVKLNNPGVAEIDRKPGIDYVELGEPGVPHAVTHQQGLKWSQMEGLLSRAAALRRDPAFPKGANVNFYDWIGDCRVRVLTYERGVEDYTLACGTGCGATAVALWLRGELPEGRLTVENRGGTLDVTVSGWDGVVDSILLEGPTELVRVYEI